MTDIKAEENRRIEEEILRLRLEVASCAHCAALREQILSLIEIWCPRYLMVTDDKGNIRQVIREPPPREIINAEWDRLRDGPWETSDLKRKE
jgi:hypothetical protein